MNEIVPYGVSMKSTRAPANYRASLSLLSRVPPHVDLIVSPVSLNHHPSSAPMTFQSSRLPAPAAIDLSGSVTSWDARYATHRALDLSASRAPAFIGGSYSSDALVHYARVRRIWRALERCGPLVKCGRKSKIKDDVRVTHRARAISRFGRSFSSRASLHSNSRRVAIDVASPFSPSLCFSK